MNRFYNQLNIFCLIFGSNSTGLFRFSAAVAYLHPVLSRPNLTTLNNILVTRVIFENKKAVGIELVEKGVTKVVVVELSI